jgi:hypothetical protein
VFKNVLYSRLGFFVLGLSIFKFIVGALPLQVAQFVLTACKTLYFILTGVSSSVLRKEVGVHVNEQKYASYPDTVTTTYTNLPRFGPLDC